MSNLHARSVFANSCLSTPRKILSTSLPINSDKHKEDSNHLLVEDPLQLSLTPSTPYVHAILPHSNEKGPDTDPRIVDRNEQFSDTNERTEYAILFSTLLESNALLLDEIRALKQQQQSSFPEEPLAEQEQLRKTSPPQLLRDTWVTPSGEQPTSSSQTQSDEDDHCGEIVEDIEPTDIGEDFSSDTSSISSKAVDPFASPGALAVQTMWDSFSVDEYSVLNDTEEVRRSPKQGKREWTSTITVPQPFSMTVREANTPKQKSWSLRMAEEEQLRKVAAEEAELMKKFRASPIPASTFLPLYELVNAKNEQRREEIKKMSKDLLKANERPFSFTKRESELKQMKAKQAALVNKIEERELKRNRFRAKPIPKHVFSPLINERMREQEEYRKIKIRMRSEELLASSKLPGTMHLRGQYRHSQKSEPENGEDEKHLFHPNINGTVPDYDQAYCEFQRRLATKKRTKQATVPEPFHLHVTSETRETVITKHKESQEAYVGPQVKASRRSPHHSRSRTVSSTYPTQMTHTALLRQSLQKEKAASDLQNHLKELDQLAERREKGKQVKRSVLEKSLTSDPTAWLEEKKKQKLQEFQKLDRERQEQYQHQLNEMKERVQSRPLLLEQASQMSARRSAEAKYKATLRKAGLSEKEIQALEHKL